VQDFVIFVFFVDSIMIGLFFGKRMSELLHNNKVSIMSVLKSLFLLIHTSTLDALSVASADISIDANSSLPR
jgi:hypothetical protein